MNQIKGAGVALVTPFKSDKSIDYCGLEKLINHSINGGIDYLVIMGTTGESVTLNKEEKNKIIKFCKAINDNRLPIILGVGGNNTTQVLQEISSINLDGIYAILSVSPYYNKPTQDGIYEHYKEISKKSKIPIIMYNVPSRTGSNINANTVIKLANNCDNIIGIKEASGNIEQIMQIINNKPDNFQVISGDDALTVPMIYLGASGVISVIGQVYPNDFSDMVKEALAGNITNANFLHYKLLDFYKPLYDEGNPVGVKAALELINICYSHVRKPLLKASPKIFDDIKTLSVKYST